MKSLRKVLLICLSVMLLGLPLLPGAQAWANPTPIPTPTPTPTAAAFPGEPPGRVPAEPRDQTPVPAGAPVSADEGSSVSPSPDAANPSTTPAPHSLPAPGAGAGSPESAPRAQAETAESSASESPAAESPTSDPVADPTADESPTSDPGADPTADESAEPTPLPSPEPSPTAPMAPATPRALSDDAINRVWQANGGGRGWLGAPTVGVACGLRDGGCFRRFQGGSIYWTPAHGAYFIRGAISERWGAGEWERGRLGYPVSDEFCGLRGGGCGQRFTGGLIYWSAPTGARAVWGAIQERYASVGWETSLLGLPASDEFCGLRDDGCGQRFTGGLVLWNPSIGANPVSASHHARYAQEGFESGRLGYPLSARFCGLRNGGCGQRFTGGYIYSQAAVGTHAVLGTIRHAYEVADWERGPLGYPTSDEGCGLVQRGCVQHFQKGIILWSPGTGAYPVRGAILDKYAASQYERGTLGYPIAAQGTVNGQTVQRFQNGVLSLSSTGTGATVVNGAYPDNDAVPCGSNWCKFGSVYSARGFAYRNCTDYAAWKKGMVWSQIAGRGDGHARGWRQGWIDRGRTVSTVPKVGSIAWWGPSRGGGYGHVAIVVAVNRNGSVNVEHYNYEIRGGYSVTRNLRAEAYLY